MKIIKLKQPLPRTTQLDSSSHVFRYSGFLPLPRVRRIKMPNLGIVLTNRRTKRDFQTPLSFQQLATLIWHSARLREKRLLENGTLFQSRIAPSGGGCHPIHIVVMGAPDFSRDILIYDAEHNGFGVVAEVDIRLLRKTFKETDDCLRVRKGTVFWFLADVAKTAIKYQHPESLIWRDSGALLTVLELVAEGLGLQSCALGIHETPSLRRILKLPPTVIGVGGCIVSE